MPSFIFQPKNFNQKSSVSGIKFLACMCVVFACCRSFAQDATVDISAEAVMNSGEAADTFAPKSLPSASPFTQKDNQFNAQNNGEDTELYGNYWDGVDDQSNLRVAGAQSLYILDEGGKMVRQNFPCSPNFVDIDGDGLKDLVVGDAWGFVWIFRNTGDAGKPHFTKGGFIPTFVGNGAKVHVADWDEDGDLDVIAGTLFGDMSILKNVGTRQRPEFTTGMGIPRYVFPRDKMPKFAIDHVEAGGKVMILGNYLAPWVIDWNNDGKPDLLWGDGTYSANSIRMLVNAGSRGRPTFTRDRMFYLAYGEGFEHLTPCMVDYNGDKIPDLIVGTRTGQFRMHKGKPPEELGENLVATLKGLQPPAVLEFDKFLKIAGKDTYGAMSIAYPCDWNEDGLFDLLLGTIDGRIGLALNTGTPQEPQFDKVEFVKGANETKDRRQPRNWWVGVPHTAGYGDYYYSRDSLYCNSAYMLTSDDVMSGQGFEIRPKEGNTFMHFQYMRDINGNLYPGWVDDRTPGARAIHGPELKLEYKKKYDFSFFSILQGNSVRWILRGIEVTRLATEDQADAWEWRTIEGQFSSSSQWAQRTQTVTCPLKKSDIQSNITMRISFYLPEGTSELLLDGFSFRESSY